MAITFSLLLGCVLDWWVILRSLTDPQFLQVDSTAILFVTPTPVLKYRSFCSRLESFGYFLDWARTGSAAVTALRQNPFNLIVIDPLTRDLDLNALRMEVNLYQSSDRPKIVTLRSSEEITQIPRYLEIGLPPDRFL
jgi:hypothetical protein